MGNSGGAMLRVKINLNDQWRYLGFEPNIFTTQHFINLYPFYSSNLMIFRQCPNESYINIRQRDDIIQQNYIINSWSYNYPVLEKVAQIYSCRIPPTISNGRLFFGREEAFLATTGTGRGITLTFDANAGIPFVAAEFVANTLSISETNNDEVIRQQNRRERRDRRGF